MRVGGLTVQVVSQNSGSGSSSRLTSLILQAVNQSGPKDVRVSNITLQAVTTSLADHIRLSSIITQTVTQSEDAGARIRATSLALQVVYGKGGPTEVRQRAWTFDFDGHICYALDMGSNGTLVYDLSTSNWSVFDTQGYGGHFNMKNGFHWRTGKTILGGSDFSGNLIEMREETFLDDGFRPVVYEVNGFLLVTEDRFYRNYALRMIGSAGRLADPDETVVPTLSMQFSDDQGVSWSDTFTVELERDTRQRIEFRSLGAFTAPGRIFRMFDEGGVKFISYCIAEVE